MLRSKAVSRRKTILGSVQASDCLARRTRSGAKAADEPEDVVKQTPERKRGAISVHNEVGDIVEEDGFRYKKRKKKEVEPSFVDVPEYPRQAKADLTAFSELASGSLPEDPQFLMCYLCETACSIELAMARETYADAAHAHVATAVEEALAAFKTGVEEMVSNDGIEFVKTRDADGEEAPDLKTRKATLRALQQKYVAEEAQWIKIKEHYEGDAQDASVAEAAAAVHAAAAAAREEVGAGRTSGALQRACLDAHRKLSLQIDGLEAVVRGAEDACRHADRARHQVAAKLEQSDTQHLPHVASPHRLVHQLIHHSDPL